MIDIIRRAPCGRLFEIRVRRHGAHGCNAKVCKQETNRAPPNALVEMVRTADAAPYSPGEDESSRGAATVRRLVFHYMTWRMLHFHLRKSCAEAIRKMLYVFE